MICEYCDGTGTQHDAVRGVSFDCPECSASGMATCCQCGQDADTEDDDGDYLCEECWMEAAL